ncbi:MAG TPA: hypothetical protein VGX92_00335 [Pyrinomonadaceae bacterium]|jgi:hypothetical protein|nr:hypothetical protein [Pyrinomonadaceae bacterium]
MAKYTSPLDHVTVAAACPADWDAMIGNERARFCGQCRLNVYNLSGMTKREAEALIASAEGRLCVRFYRRADGTILTENCPVGLRALKRKLSRITRAALSAVLSFLAGLGLYTALEETKPPFVMGTRSRIDLRVDVPPNEPINGRLVTGEMFVPPTIEGTRPTGRAVTR